MSGDHSVRVCVQAMIVVLDQKTVTSLVLSANIQDPIYDPISIYSAGYLD